MLLLDQYIELRDALFAYFGYVESWHVFPVDDTRQCFWRVSAEGPGTLQFADSEEELHSQTGGFYQEEIYTYHHLDKWVYRGEKYTMILTDTRVDGNKFLRIFCNDKERV